MHRIPVGVLGASGYAGRELCALVARHPRFELAFATANERRGERARLGGADVRFVAHDDAPLSERRARLLRASARRVGDVGGARARSAGARAVDLSSDLRPGNGSADVVPYGLTEVARGPAARRRRRRESRCYPTAILLALVPLAKRGLIAPAATVIATAASGVTGAG